MSNPQHAPPSTQMKVPIHNNQGLDSVLFRFFQKLKIDLEAFLVTTRECALLTLLFPTTEVRTSLSLTPSITPLFPDRYSIPGRSMLVTGGTPLRSGLVQPSTRFCELFSSLSTVRTLVACVSVGEYGVDWETVVLLV